MHFALLLERDSVMNDDEPIAPDGNLLFDEKERRRAERKKKWKERPFEVELKEQGSYGDAMTTLEGKPAYCRKVGKLHPCPGEVWTVYTYFKNSKFIILHPVAFVRKIVQ